MYVLMFIAAMNLRRSQPGRSRSYRVPALGLLCVLGIVSSVVAFVIGFIPPSQFSHLNPLKYTLQIVGGILLIGLLPPFLMDRLRKPSWKAGDDASTP
jgi:glutamate:GABA antiporter